MYEVELDRSRDPGDGIHTHTEFDHDEAQEDGNVRGPYLPTASAAALSAATLSTSATTSPWCASSISETGSNSDRSISVAWSAVWFSPSLNGCGLPGLVKNW